jgi:hypothetical protein
VGYGGGGGEVGVWGVGDEDQGATRYHGYLIP